MRRLWRPSDSQRCFSEGALKKRKSIPRPRRSKAPSSSPGPTRPGRKENFLKQFVVLEVEWRRRVRRAHGKPARWVSAPALHAWLKKYFGHIGSVDKRTIQRWISRNRT